MASPRPLVSVFLYRVVGQACLLEGVVRVVVELVVFSNVLLVASCAAPDLLAMSAALISP